MKKTNLYLAFILAAVYTLLVSCKKTSIETAGYVQKTASFEYDGKIYYATALIKYNKDGNIEDGKLIEGKDNEVLTQIFSDKNTGMLVLNETSFYLYKGENGFEKATKLYNPCTGYWTNVTPASNNLPGARFECKPDWKVFKDYGNVHTMSALYAASGNGLNSAFNVSPANNDKISVVYTRGGKYDAPHSSGYSNRQAVTLYAHSGFAGPYITFYSTCCCEGIFRLKDYIAWWVWFVPVSWNDQASSIKTTNAFLHVPCR